LVALVYLAILFGSLNPSIPIRAFPTAMNHSYGVDGTKL